MIYLDLLQQNFLKICAGLAFAYFLLWCLVRFLKRLTKITKTKADDKAVGVLEKIVAAFGGLAADLKGVKKSSLHRKAPKDQQQGQKNDAGFIHPAIAWLIGVFAVGLILGGLLVWKLMSSRPAVPPQPSTPAISEASSSDSSSAMKKGSKKKIEREFNCPDGSLSKETESEENTEEQIQALLTASSRKQDQLLLNQSYLNLLGGGGVALQNVEKFSDLNFDKLKPQLAVGAEYGDQDGGWAAFVASDGNKTHNGYLMKSWRLKK